MKNKVLKRILILATASIIAATCLVGLCACNNNKVEHYAVNKADSSIMGYGDVMLNAIFNLAVDEENTYLELDGKGNLHMQIRTKAGLLGESLDALLNTFGMSKADLSAALGSFDIKGGVDTTVEPMFPGFRAKLEQGDLDGALKLIQRSLGFYLYGLDYNNEDIKAALQYVGENMKLPENLLDIIPADTQLTLTFDNKYYTGETVGTDGTKYQVIYISDITENPYTQPFGIFTVSEKNGKKLLTLRIEFMAVQLSFIQQ
ncbi:MAG: hypothetical protein K2M36_02035 [Clostridia bacterium]|nr:hypothetical protein [Clostridia bacterium]